MRTYSLTSLAKGTLEKPLIGDIRYGNEIGLKGKVAHWDKLMWIQCSGCGVLKWVRLGKVKRRHYDYQCPSCSHKRLRKVRGSLAKGTLDNPIVGDIRWGDEFGKSYKITFIYVQCPVCKEKRWCHISNYKASSKRNMAGICLDCYRHLTGDESHNWRGGVHVKNGYRRVILRSDNVFFAMASRDGYVYEHRLVMAQHLGRCLYAWEVVHHKNRIKTDNEFENLELKGISEHNGLTLAENQIRNLEIRVERLEENIEYQSQTISLLLWHIGQLNAENLVVTED